MLAIQVLTIQLFSGGVPAKVRRNICRRLLELEVLQEEIYITRPHTFGDSPLRIATMVPDLS